MWEESGDQWVIDRYMSEEEAKKKVLEKYPKAFIKRTVDKYYVYQVKVRTGWFSSKPLGDKHYFADQAWRSALNNIVKAE